MIVFFTAMLAAMGAPGIPSGGMVIMLLILQSVGLPVEAIAIASSHRSTTRCFAPQSMLKEIS